MHAHPIHVKMVVNVSLQALRAVLDAFALQAFWVVYARIVIRALTMDHAVPMDVV